MPRGIAKNPSEKSRKISDKHRGNHHSPATEFKKGVHYSLTTEFKKGMVSLNKGKTHSEETRKKISISKKKNPVRFWLGKKRSPKDIEKFRNSHLGKTLSEETKLKMSKTAKRKGFGKWMIGKKSSEETKRKIRESAFEYAKRVAGIICPRVGRNEKEILDKMEIELLYKIMRQFKIAGYFVDGYIPELKLVIEVDEKPKDKKKDIEREEIIKNKLNCQFLRIKDYA